jgi:hypothetical protein
LKQANKGKKNEENKEENMRNKLMWHTKKQEKVKKRVRNEM